MRMKEKRSLNRAIAATLLVILCTLLGTATAQATEVTVMLPGEVPMTLVHVPAGKFLMGSPPGERGNVLDNETQHEVTLTKDYYIGKTEVTQAQWQAVMGTPMPSHCSDLSVGDNFPVFCVTWKDITEPGGFVEKLNAHLGTTGFRLPTEAEWERASRADTQTRFSHGDVLECGDDCENCNKNDQYIWWCANSPNRSQMVGSKMANPFGLHDVHGNLFEIVQDRYGEFPSTPVIDPTGPGVGNDIVIRGGDWGGGANFSRSASRVSANPGDPGIEAANTSIGFRIAASDLEGLAFEMTAGLNGNWWSGLARNGEGAQVEISAGNGGTRVIVITVYAYDALGNQIFLPAVGMVDGDTAQLEVFITDGGYWGGNFDPELVNENPWGTGVASASSCDAIHVELYPNAQYQADGYTDQVFDLIRLTTSLLTCP